MIRYSIILLLFISLISSCNSISSTPDVIGILPYNGIKTQDVDSVMRILTDTYGLEVVILDNIDLPEAAFTTRRSPRYRADSLLRYQRRIKPDSISIIIGLTNKDISSTKIDASTMNIKEPQNVYIDWGIFGLGEVGGKSCVVSTYRLRKNVSTTKYYTRLKRISTHEVGHVLGLHHCPTPNCVMNDANESIKTIDNSTGKLCNDCWSTIK